MESEDDSNAAASHYTAADLIALAKTLRADQVEDDAKRLLSVREFEVWKHTEIDGFTAWRTAAYMGISVRSVMYALRRARLALGQWRVEEKEGKVKLGLTIVEGGQSKFAVDPTMADAHWHTRAQLTGLVIDAIGDVEEDLDQEPEEWMEEAA